MVTSGNYLTVIQGGRIVRGMEEITPVPKLVQTYVLVALHPEAPDDPVVVLQDEADFEVVKSVTRAWADRDGVDVTVLLDDKEVFYYQHTELEVGQ